jgi:hypothetical protein
MKKILIYILIAVILVGNLFPTGLVHAQATPLGTCIENPSNFLSKISYDKAKTYCDGFTDSEWRVNNPQGQPAPHLGACLISPGNFTWTDSTGCTNGKWQGESSEAATAARLAGGSGPSSPLDKIGCDAIGSASILSCMARVIQFFFVTLPGLLVAIAARTFDLLAGLTLSNKMYEFSFIQNIWKIIRDFSNIAFILVLLFAALQTILGLGHGGAKKTIAAVIVMALVVNFSLFFTRVVIDSGNILALVFYNGIKVDGAPEDSISDPTLTNVQEKSLSRAIVNRFDILKVLNGGQFNTESHSSVTGGLEGAAAGCVAGASFFGIGCPIGALAGGILGSWLFGGTSLDNNSLLAIMGIMVSFGLILYALMYSFFVAAFSFLGRMITLIMLMIVSPFAFVSYAVPGLKKLNRVGFDSWLHTLLSSTFMGAVYMFILFVVTALMKEDMFSEITKKNLVSDNPIGFLVVTFLPGILISMLLIAGARYAKKASGEFSERIIGLGKATAGIVLGGAALTTGFAGRTALGRTTAALSRRDDAKKYGKDLYDWENKGKVGPKPMATSNLGWIGGRINRAQLKSGEVSHAQHEMDELKKKAGIEGLDKGQISGVDQLRLLNEFQKSNRAQIETDIKRGHDDKGRDVIINKDASGATMTPVKGTDEYISERRKVVNSDIQRNPASFANGDTDISGDLTDQGRKKAENILTKEVNTVIKDLVPEIAKNRYQHLDDESSQKIGVGTRLAARSTSGSYDPRNVANIKIGPSMGIGTKAAAGLIAAVATGIRVGLKSGGGIDMGTPKRDLILDLKDTISSALKSMKVNVDIKHDSGSHKDDHGTSGGGHH